MTAVKLTLAALLLIAVARAIAGPAPSRCHTTTGRNICRTPYDHGNPPVRWSHGTLQFTSPHTWATEQARLNP